MVAWCWSSGRRVVIVLVAAKKQAEAGDRI